MVKKMGDFATRPGKWEGGLGGKNIKFHRRSTAELEGENRAATKLCHSESGVLNGRIFNGSKLGCLECE